MKNKKILVLLKIYKGDINPFDECALEYALNIPNSEVISLAMAPLSAKASLERVTRLGSKAILLCDPSYAGSDTIATANILSKAIEYINPDLVFAGRKSVDGNTAQTPIMISEITGYELISNVVDVKDGKAINREKESFEIKDKQILSFEKSKVLRSPSIFSEVKEVEILSNKNLNVEKGLIGQHGSKTIVRKTYVNENGRRFCDFYEKDQLDYLINLGLSKRENQSETTSQSIAVIYYVGNIEKVCLNFTKNAIKLDFENKPLEEICKEIKNINPKIILWEENHICKELACRVAIKMGIGLCAECTDVRCINNKIIITRPAIGGDIMADIECISPISMATIRKVEESDDISFVVGKGAVPYLDKIKALANKYNAKIYCTRPLADNGVIDYLYQVGLSGINITPHVCVTFGVSGSVQTIVGLNKSKTVISINKVRKEKIFDYSDYGIVTDIKDI